MNCLRLKNRSTQPGSVPSALRPGAAGQEGAALSRWSGWIGNALMVVLVGICAGLWAPRALALLTVPAARTGLIASLPPPQSAPQSASRSAPQSALQSTLPSTAHPAPPLPQPAAAGLKPDDIRAIHSAVQAQLDAFAADDGDKAFGLSSRDTRSRFGTSENFLRAVRKFYPPIYRHRRVQFSGAELVNGDAIQLLNVIDSANHVWLAVYRLEREAEGVWKIDGCRLHPTSGISI